MGPDDCLSNLILAGSVVQSNTSLRSPEVELPIFPLAWFWYTSIHAQCFCYKNQLQIYRYTPNPNPSKHHIRMQHDLFAAWSISHARIWTYTDSGSTQAWRKSHKLSSRELYQICRQTKTEKDCFSFKSVFHDAVILISYGVFSCPEQLNRWPCH